MSIKLKDHFEINIPVRKGYVITFPYVNEYHHIHEFTKEQVLRHREEEEWCDDCHSYTHRQGNPCYNKI